MAVEPLLTRTKKYSQGGLVSQLTRVCSQELWKVLQVTELGSKQCSRDGAQYQGSSRAHLSLPVLMENDPGLSQPACPHGG